MKKNIIPIILFIFVLTVFILPAGKALAIGAAPRALEVQYIPVPQATTPTTAEIKLPDYVKYIYYFFIIVSGLIALGVIIMAGTIYLSSAGMPERTKDAKDRIQSALIGLLILFCSGLMFKTISPDLFQIEYPKPPFLLTDISPGVYLCKTPVPIIQFWQERKQLGDSPTKEGADRLSAYSKQINENCILAYGGDIQKDYIDQGKHLYLVPVLDKQQYGAIVFEESGFSGKAAVFYGAGTNGAVQELTQPTAWQVPGRAGSIKTFILDFNASPSSYAALYKHIDFNRKEPALAPEIKQIPPNMGAGGFNLAQNKEIGSLKVEGPIFVIFFKTSGAWQTWNQNTEIDVYSASDTNLNDNLMGIWNPSCAEPKPGFEPPYRNFPCAGSIVIVSALE